MTEEQIAEFNNLYKKACQKMKGLVILEEYRPKGISFFEKMRAKKAIKYFEQLLSIHPEHFPSLFFLGKLHQRLQNYDNALIYFETALKMEHSNHNIPQEASLVAMHLNQVDKAIEYSTEASRRKPNDFALLGNHSMNLLIGGYDKEAKETIDLAISINPNDHINRLIKSKIEGVISGQIRRPTFQESVG